MSQHSEPPKWILRILDWWVAGHLREETKGDLYELYDEHLRRGDGNKAKWLFIWNALRFCRLYNFDRDHLNSYPMLWKNYLRIAWRQLRRDKFYAFVNVLGIAIGIGCFLAAFFYIQTERSYDQHHPNKERIYRVSQNYQSESGESVPLAYSFNPLSSALEDRLPFIEKTTRIFNISGGYGEDGGQFTNIENQVRHIERTLFFADSTFFDFFDYHFIEGSRETALAAPYQIVLKESTAKKYFGEASALGKVLEYRADDETLNFTVGGVVTEPLGPSHFDFQLLASFSSLGTTMPWIDNWYYPPVYHYAMLEPGTDMTTLDEGLNGLPQQLFPSPTADEISFEAQSITDIHLYSHREGELGTNGYIYNLTLFGLIGGLILLIACINYMNLATARASTRIKEVNVRRVFGARRRQLIEQFMGESLLFTTLAFGLALLLVKLSIPLLRDLFQTSLRIDWFGSWSMPLILAGILISVVLLAGLYPSVFLSAVKLGKNVSGHRRSSVSSALSVRKVLVVFQFTISGALIAMALLVGRQVKHLQNKQLGFEKDQVLIIPLRDQDNQEQYETIKEQFLQISKVSSATGCSGYPGGRGFSEFFILPRQGAFDSLEVQTLTVDEDFAETFGLQIMAGRDFSRDFPADATNNFLVNEALAKRLNWQEPVGQEIMLRHYYRGEQEKHGRVVGVVGDFHYRSLRESIRPLLFHILPGSYFYNYLSIRIDPSDITTTLDQLSNKWSAYNPDRLFEYYFLDESFAQLYEQEQQFNALFQLFTGLAVIIACLGLFALAAFSIERRNREVAVRKVLGATSTGIMWLLSVQFARLALLALLIAIPMAWYFTRVWLNNFAYRIDIGWQSFLLAGLTIVLLAILVSGYHAFRAANLNPAQVLKHDE